MRARPPRAAAGPAGPYGMSWDRRSTRVRSLVVWAGHEPFTGLPPAVVAGPVVQKTKGTSIFVDRLYAG
jgi:hypothetical protein